jgi:cysteine desulfurase
VQTLGHIPVDVDELNVDLLSASAHKLYGPKGAGMLYIRKGVRMHPFMHGGDQEKGRRASTHNVPGIVGFGKAIQLAREELTNESVQLSCLRDYLIKGILERISQSSLNGHPERRLPNNVNVSIPYTEGEAMLVSLDMEGIACSTGSACTSSSLEPSHVLMAIGIEPEVAQGTLRLSLGRSTIVDDNDNVIEVLAGVVARLRVIP